MAIVKTTMLGFLVASCAAFLKGDPSTVQHSIGRQSKIISSSTKIQGKKPTSTTTAAATTTTFADITESDTSNQSLRDSLKESILAIAKDSKRGFVATSQQRTEVSDIINKLKELNPSSEPASAFYSENNNMDADVPTLTGKWTLVYTDAPDIISLDSSLSPMTSLLPSNVKLGRIGQECIPEESTIKNVIEWKRPDWLKGVLEQVAGKSSEEIDKSGGSRVLQKVCCEAKASPSQPSKVDLKLSGFELVGSVIESSSDGLSGDKSLLLPSVNDIVMNGPAAWFELNPLQLSGPLKAPFGQFELLYLDQNIRIIQTGQGFFAVNLREVLKDEWF